MIILDIFRRFLKEQEKTKKWSLVKEIIMKRVATLIDKILSGLHLDWDSTLNLIREHNRAITRQEQETRKILIAAIENIIDFATAEENKMLIDIQTHLDNEDLETCEKLFEKYNKTYAQSEDKDVEYAALIASWWIQIPNESIITYMTQGDERVRASHLSLEGVSYPKRSFPNELIPPIDFGCRCFLISNGFSSVHAMLPSNQLRQVNKIFQESLATGGKIFSEHHPYFKEKLHEEIEVINQKLKRKILYHENNP